MKFNVCILICHPLPLWLEDEVDHRVYRVVDDALRLNHHAVGIEQRLLFRCFKDWMEFSGL